MSSSNKFVILSVVCLLICVVRVYCGDLTEDEIIALTRDHLARKDQDAFFGGFFAAWAATIYIIAGCSLVLSIISFCIFILGCRRPGVQLKLKQEEEI